uniref:hypothetical protein n=1 Tax=Sulfuriferula sp. GW6 TaxID=3345112 RepID=UPI0039F6536A
MTVANELPPEFGQLLPSWFRDMSDCGMMLLWLAIALTLTLLANAFGAWLRPDLHRLAWIVAALAWVIVFFQAVLCARAWWRRT